MIMKSLRHYVAGIALSGGLLLYGCSQSLYYTREANKELETETGKRSYRYEDYFVNIIETDDHIEVHMIKEGKNIQGYDDNPEDGVVSFDDIFYSMGSHILLHPGVDGAEEPLRIKIGVLLKKAYENRPKRFRRD